MRRPCRRLRLRRGARGFFGYFFGLSLNSSRQPEQQIGYDSPWYATVIAGRAAR